MTKSTEPNTGAEFTDTALWRQAIEICESLEGLSREQVLNELSAMDLEPELMFKIQRIMENMSASNPLLDQHDYQCLINNLKQGNHLIGKNIDGYLIKKLIAKGGMSTVYEAEYIHAKHQKTVAIKLLSPYGITDKAIELFNREQLILSKLSHPSIVAFHHSGVTEDGTHYLVMEYIDQALNLVDYVTKKQLSKQAIIQLIKNLCDVFSYAHAKQIIHRDIKPANILVNHSGQVKVIDFGIGRLEQLEGQTVTKVFTPDAASPEQLLGQTVNLQSDVFSLGALLLQLLVKQKPLPKTNFKNYDPQHDVIHINQLLKASDLDVDLKNIITTAMHVESKFRYQDMSAFADDLDNWLNSKPVNATADSFTYRCKKLFLRNKSLSLLLSLVLVIAVFAITAITTLEFQKQKVTSQRDSSFALIEAMIDQANPITNSNQKVDGDAMVKNLNELASNQAKLLNSDTELSHFFYNKLGGLYHSKGLYDQSLASYQTAFGALKTMIDEDNEQYISAELMIAQLLETTGKYKQAQSAAENMLIKLDDLTGINPRQRLNALYLLSKLHQYQAENEMSEAYGKKALAWMEKHPEVDSEIQASVYNSLAVTNRNLGHVELAEKQYKKAIELLTPIQHKQLELSGIMVNLAILKGRSGDMKSSETLFNQAFDVIKEIDINHPHLAMAYLPYSTLLQFTDRLDDSERVIEEAIKMLSIQGEEKHLASAYMKYARIGLLKHNIDLTLEYLVKSYVLYKEITGEDHPVIYDLYNMALWVLMLEPHRAYGLDLIETIDLKRTTAAVNSNEYKIYKVQRAWSMQQPSKVDMPDAVFPNHFYQQNNPPGQKWLDQMSDAYQGKSDLVDAWLALNTAINSQDRALIVQTCDASQSWFDSSRLAFKVMIIDQCVDYIEHLLPDSQETFKQLKFDLSSNNDIRKQLINDLLTTMQ